MGKKGKTNRMGQPRPDSPARVPVVVPAHPPQVVASIDSSGKTVLSLRMENLPAPDKVYDADHAWVTERAGAVSLWFGKSVFGGDSSKLRSMIELRMSPDRFANFWKSTQNGFQTETEALVAQWSTVQVTDRVPLEEVQVNGDKVHSDWAAIAQISRTGGLASIDFHYVPPREVIKAQAAANVRHTFDMVPVMRVNISIGPLALWMKDVSALGGRVEAGLPNKERGDDTVASH